MRCRLILADNWVTVPTNSVLTIHKQTVLIHPIEDQFYSHNPAHARNAAFAADKGLVSADAGTVDMARPCGNPNADAVRRKLQEMQLHAPHV